MTIPEIEKKLYPFVSANECKRLDWYKKHDIKKYLSEYVYIGCGQYRYVGDEI